MKKICILPVIEEENETQQEYVAIEPFYDCELKPSVDDGILKTYFSTPSFEYNSIQEKNVESIRQCNETDEKLQYMIQIRNEMVELEKMCDTKDPKEMLKIVERACYLCNILYNMECNETEISARIKRLNIFIRAQGTIIYVLKKKLEKDLKEIKED